MTKEKCLTQLILQKTPSIPELMTENRSLRIKNRIAYAGIIGLSAFLTLVGHHTAKTNSQLTDIENENSTLKAEVSHLQTSTSELVQKNQVLSNYATDAQKLTNSMQFYPDMPDFINSLPENEQGKALKELEIKNQKMQYEHNKTLENLGIDIDLLRSVQRGIHSAK